MTRDVILKDDYVERIDVSIFGLRGDWMLFFQENVGYVQKKQICAKVSVNFS